MILFDFYEIRDVYFCGFYEILMGTFRISIRWISAPALISVNNN